jgi:hypothetical protein
MSEEKIDTTQIIEELVDYLMPELTPHETSMYIFLLRNSHIRNGTNKIRIGQRTIAQKYGRGPKMSVPSRAHITRQINVLEEKSCIRIGDTNREGTLYEVLLPAQIPLVIEKFSASIPDVEENYYNDEEKRKELYERDHWICQYCGEKVSAENITLDHFIPRHSGGSNKKENLRTSCLMCNSVKSGKTYEEAAVHLLKSIQERRKRNIENV